MRRAQPINAYARRAGASRTRPSGWSTIRLRRRGRILWLTLDRPAVLNAYNTVMRDEVFTALGLATEDPSVNVLVVDGAGRAFSSGGDLSEFGTAPSPVRAREVRQARDVWRRWAELPCVSIASVHGVAAGGGLEMALLCDLIVCSTDARFGLPETGLALIPGVGGTQTLPRAVGSGRAASLLLTDTWIRGREAVRIGLAVECVARGALGKVTSQIAKRVAALDPRLVRAAKESIRRGADLRLGEALGLERRLTDALGRKQQ